MRVPPAQRSLTAFSLEVCGRQQEQKLLKGCLSTELKEMSGSERVVWLQWPSQRASNTICRDMREGRSVTQRVFINIKVLSEIRSGERGGVSTAEHCLSLP